MKTVLILLLAITLIDMSAQSIYEIPVKDIHGNETTLEQYRGKTMLIVNVASKCGLTPQYEDLQNLYDELSEEGLVILGFPANNFMGQEPGTNEEILEFCSSNYGVGFPMFSKISVKGADMHPLYQFLTRESLNGKADSDVSWNFQKYLVGKDGELLEIIAPRDRVSEDNVKAIITAAL